MSASLYDLIQPLQPFANALVKLAGRAGVQPRVTSTLRTRSQQERLYAAYLRGENAYPVAPPGTSAHEYGFAFDMVAATREDLHDLGSIWVQNGGVWHAEDEVHFEYPGFRAPVAAVDSSPSIRNEIKAVAEGYADIPWYLSWLFPAAATTAHGTIETESKGSPGARQMCKWGYTSFC